MNWLLRIVLVSMATLFACFVVIGAMLPSTYVVSRSTEIHAPIETVYTWVSDLRNNERWSPWVASDPTVRITYGPKTEGIGAWYHWTSEDSGAGRLTVIDASPPKRWEAMLDFREQGEAKDIWHFEKKGNAVKVTWTLQGDTGNNLAARYLALLMDRMVGPSFEDGLRRLSSLVTAQASRSLPANGATLDPSRLP